MKKNESCSRCGYYGGLDEAEEIICSRDGGFAKCDKANPDLAGTGLSAAADSRIIVVRQLPIIEQNLRSLADQIDKEVESALSMVCTEDTLASVKKTRADMNKQLAALETQRKEVKRAIMEPYDAFERVYKECVTDKYAKADASFKEKISDTESGLKQKKSDELRAYFPEEAKARHVEFLTLEDSGINVTLTASLKSLKASAKKFIGQVTSDVDMIATQDAADEIMAEYRKNGYQASRAITTVKDRHVAIQRQREEMERREAQRRQDEEAAQRLRESAPDAFSQPAETGADAFAPPVESTPAPVSVQPEVPAAGKDPDEIVTVSFRITDTRRRCIVLRDYLKKNGYQYQ